jgi:hypothetical protein
MRPELLCGAAKISQSKIEPLKFADGPTLTNGVRVSKSGLKVKLPNGENARGLSAS